MMKKITLLIACLGTGIFTAALAVLTRHFPNLFSSIMTFPFEQIGCGLGVLSKTGSLGNGAAVAVWIGISAIPIIIALRYKRSKETLWERVSLYVLSAAVLLALYGMVNPQLFHAVPFDNSLEFLKLIKTILGVGVWAVVVLYLTLRLIRLFRQGNKEQLLKYMQNILYILCILFTGAAAISIINGGIALMDAAQAPADAGFEVFRLVAELAPYVFDIIIILRLTDLLGIARDKKQEGIAESAGRVSRICCLALGITTALTAGSNLVQIALMRHLSNISVTVNIPVISIAFTVMVLLFSRLLIENKVLHDDNDLFI